MLDTWEEPPIARGAWRFEKVLVVLVPLMLLAFVGGCLYLLANVPDHLPASPPPSPTGLNAVVSADGSTAYVSEPAHDRLVVLDTRTGGVLAQVPTGSTPSGLALSPDGRQVWVVDTNVPGLPLATGEVTVVSTSTYQVLSSIMVGSGPIDVAFSPDGTHAYVTNNGPIGFGALSAIDTSFHFPVSFITPSSVSSSVFLIPYSMYDWYPTSVAVSLDGSQIWVSETSTLTLTGQDDYVYVLDAHTVNTVGQGPSVLAKIKVGRGPFFMVLPPGSPYAYVADKESCDVKRIDTSTFQVVSTVQLSPVSGCPFGLSASPNSSIVYVATGNDKTVNLGSQGRVVERVDFTTGAVSLTGFLGSDPVTVTLDPTGTLLYVVDADTDVIQVLNTQSGAVVGSLRLPPYAPTPTTGATATGASQVRGSQKGVIDVKEFVLEGEERGC